MDRIHEKISSLKGLDLQEEIEFNSSGYDLKEDIGSGTFGQVKLALHIDSNIPVAIKVLNKEEIKQNDDFERVARELDILVKMNHPNIIYLYEVPAAHQIIEEEDNYFLVTEYCPDGDLETLLKKKRRLSEAEAMRYIVQIISAVSYLHEQKIVHRDIKPENILLVGDKIKLIDFGLSNLYNPRERLKTPCGSPCFAPPEMVCGMPYDPMKSDVWSIGITLYYLVVGFLPFIDKDLKTLYQKIVSNKLHFPSFLSPQLVSLLNSMLGSNPAQRPSLATLLSSPLMPPISFAPSPSFETPDPDILKTVSRQCKISEQTVIGYLKNKNKNAFTAQ